MTTSHSLLQRGSQACRNSQGPTKSAAHCQRTFRLGIALAPGLLAVWCVLEASGPSPAQERDTLRGHKSSVFCLAPSPDGKTLASASHNGEIKLWDLKTGKVLAAFKPPPNYSIRGVAFSPDGQTLATGGEDRAVRLWATDGWKERKTLGPAEGVYLLAYSQDGKSLAAGGSVPQGKKHTGVCTIWDLETGEERAIFQGHDGYLISMALSPDGQILATGARDGLVKLWDVKAGKECLSLRADAEEVLALAFSPDGKTLATCGPEWHGAEKRRWVRLWDVATGKERFNFSTRWNQPLRLGYSPDGKALAVGDGCHLVLWDVASYKPRAVLGEHDRDVYALAFSKDGKTLFTGGGDWAIKVWDVPDE